jgi:hypothetical protein
MKYAVEMGSGAMIFIPSFIKIGSAIEKLTGENTDTQYGDCMSLLLFYKKKKGRLKMKVTNTIVCLGDCKQALD